MAGRYAVAIPVVLAMLAYPGCSVYKAATQPGPADLSVLRAGSPRIQVISAFGAPEFVGSDEQGRKQDTFEFQSGFNQASKVRILPYLAADFFTVGLAEIILWPMEMTLLERSTCRAVVTYDESYNVKNYVLRKKGGLQSCGRGVDSAARPKLDTPGTRTPSSPPR